MSYGAGKYLLFPVLTVVALPINIENLRIVHLPVHTIESYCEAAWIWSWFVKRVNATSGAKSVAGVFCAKLVESNLIFSLQKFKICSRDDKMVVLFHVANRAITFIDADSCISFEFKPDGATMATTFHRNHPNNNRFKKCPINKTIQTLTCALEFKNRRNSGWGSVKSQTRHKNYLLTRLPHIVARRKHREDSQQIESRRIRAISLKWSTHSSRRCLKSWNRNTHNRCPS